MLAHAEKAERIREEAALRRGLGERSERRSMMIGHAERGRVGHDPVGDGHLGVDAREAEPVSAAQPDRPERVGATVGRAKCERQCDPLVRAGREAGADRLVRHPRLGWFGCDALGQREAHLEPGHRQRLSVRDDQAGGERIASDHSRRREFDLHLDAAEGGARRDERHRPPRERRGAGDEHDRLARDRRADEQGQRDRPGEEAGALHGHATGRGSSAGTATRPSTSLTTAVGVRPRIWASASRNRRCRSTAGACRFTSSGST